MVAGESGRCRQAEQKSCKTSKSHKYSGISTADASAIVVAASALLELESFLGTVPGMIYRSRLAPPPYSIEFVSDEMTAIAGLPGGRLHGASSRSACGRAHPSRTTATARGRLVALPRTAPSPRSSTGCGARTGRTHGSSAGSRKVVARTSPVWVHGAALDVTARHEAEELRRRLEAEQARRGDRGVSRAASSRRATTPGAGSSATCTTAPSSASSSR